MKARGHWSMTGRRGWLVGCLCVAALCARASTTSTWQNASSTWSTAGNWSAGVPSATSVDALLPAAAVRVNPNLTANTSTFGILAIDNSEGNYDITGSYTIDASEIAVVGGGATRITGVIYPAAATRKLTVGTAELTLNKQFAFGGTGTATLQTSTTGAGSVTLAGGIRVGSLGATSARTVALTGGGTVLVGSLYSGTAAASKFTTTSFGGKLEVLETAMNAVYGGWDINSGTVIMNGTSTTGPSTVNGESTGAAGPCNIGSGAILGGLGSLGAVTLLRGNPTGSSGGILRPADQRSGAATGTITVQGNLTLQCGNDKTSGGPYTLANRAKSAGTLQLDIAGTDAFDQVIALAAVDLAGSSTVYGNGRVILNIASTFAHLSEEPVFLKLIDKQSSGAISSTFWSDAAVNIPEGTTFEFVNDLSQAHEFTYTYVGGDGNDFGVVVTGHSVAPTGTTILIK